ncbi:MULTISPECIES: element excision factor XisI family protein [unclassified Nostoc]|uniref:element excision factor XisI family protein n=1 Tax=unclassified Nostoc TaxID=2593658 RepID=UPI002AD48CC1|nr:MULTISPECIES: element excision factor XisI family protein [unclassified Nostoc]MDZ8122043.1 element excision factor XisI family protein [Nostoc sp. CmiVER01]MDZ8225275.1 element excision factor XisI family protein [Nostoc sp. ChiVER01]
MRRCKRIKKVVETPLIASLWQDHYQLIYIGWQNRQRVFGPVMRFDIKNGKIWI